MLIDESGLIVRGNLSFRRMLGMESPLHSGIEMSTLGADRVDRVRLGRAIRDALRSQGPVPVETRIRALQGGPRQIAWTMAAIRLGQPHVIATGNDMTTIRKLTAALTTIEEVGRIVGALGATREALDLVIGRLVEGLRYPFVSMFFLDGTKLRLAAQSGHGAPHKASYDVDSDKGVMARAIRTGKAQLLPDVSEDPDYISAGLPIRGEICAPLVKNGRRLGVLNVETRGTDARLDDTDVTLLQAVADRLASAMVVRRERQRPDPGPEGLSALATPK